MAAQLGNAGVVSEDADDCVPRVAMAKTGRLALGVSGVLRIGGVAGAHVRREVEAD